MNHYNTPEQVAELLENQDCCFFKIYHSNKKDIAFNYDPDFEDVGKAKEQMQNCGILIGPGKFWVELKPKSRAAKGTVTKVWMQTSSNIPQESNSQIGGFPQFDAQIKGLVSAEIAKEKRLWELEQENKILKEEGKEVGIIQQLLSNPEVMQACQAILLGLASKMLGGGAPGAIAGVFNEDHSNTMNTTQQQQQQPQQQLDPNQRVLMAASKIEHAIQPWGYSIVEVLENLAKMAEENPKKLKNALSFL